MAQRVKFRRSSIAGRIPTTASLSLGELAFNTADGKVFFQRGDETIQSFFTTNAVITGSLQQSGSDSYFLSNVGIGTTSPLYPLHVNGNIQQQGTTNSIYMIDGGEIRGTSNLTVRSLGTFIAFQSAGSLFFQANNTERMRIDSATGNVGIGTTSPSSTLQVKGSGTTSATTTFLVQNSVGSDILVVKDDRSIETYDATDNVITKNNAGNRRFEVNPNRTNLVDFQVGGSDLSNLIRTDSGLNSVGIGTPGLSNTRLYVKGSGTTDSTTSLLVENSNGDVGIQVLDNGNVGIGGTVTVSGNISTQGALLLDGNDGLYLNQGAASTYSPAPGIFYSSTSGQGWYFQVPNNGQEKFSIKLGSTSATREFRVVDPSWNSLFQVQGTGDAIIANNLTVGGTVTAQEFHTEFVSASIIYQSGSTKFGDTSDDVHSFTGSLGILSGSLTLGGPTPLFYIKDSTLNTTHQLNSNNTELQIKGDQALELFANNTSSIYIAPDGDVGINTDAPSAKLDVVGTSEFNGEVNVISSPLQMTDQYYLRWGSTARIYGSSTANTLVFETAATERMRIAGSNVGIGTTSPTLGRLHLKQDSDSVIDGITVEETSGGNTMRLWMDGSTRKINAGGSNTMIEFDTSKVVFPTGNVGIGTTSPSEKLHVVGNATITGSLNMSGSINLTGDQREINILGDDGQVALKLNDASSGATDIGSVTWHVNGSSYGYIVANGTPGIDGLIMRANTNRGLTFQTNGANNRMRIQEDGNVGIGTTSPSTTLHVSGSGGGSDVLLVEPAGAPTVSLKSNSTLTDYSGLSVGNKYLLLTKNSSAIFQNLQGGLRFANGLAAKSVITEAGYFGIGHNSTNTVNYPLDVSGSANISGDLVINDTISTPNNTSLRLEPSGSTGWIFIGSPTDGTKIYHYSRGNNGQNAVYDFDAGYYRIDTTSTYGFNLQQDTLISGNLTVDGIVTAQEFHTEFVSASIIYQSGSTKFGDTSDDTHSFTGSLEVSGSTSISNKLFIGTGSFTTDKDLSIKVSDDVNGGIEVIRTNNVQKLRIGYSSITGVAQGLTLRGDGVTFNLNSSKSSGDAFTFTKTSGRRLTDTDAEQAWISAVPDIGQSGTANYVGILLDVTETSTGSGTNYLTDLRVGGSSKFNVTNDGNVGIGTTSPSQKLHVDGNIRVGDVNDVIFTNKLYGVSTGDLTLYTSGNTLLTQTGNVGIGTTSPSASLSIGDGTTSGVNVYLNKKDNNAAGYYVVNEGNAAGRTAFIRQSSGEDAEVGTSSTNNLSFLTNDTVRVHIDGDNNNGNVGIGTTSPIRLLHLSASDIGISPNVLIEQASTGNASLGFKLAGSTEFNMGIDNADGNKFKIHRNYPVGGSGNVLTIDGSNNVGIGTTSPAATLDIRGTISQTVDAQTNQYPLSFYNSHSGTNFYLLRQRVVNTGNQVRTGLGITGVPDAAFVLGSQTDQILKFATSGRIRNVQEILGSSTLEIIGTDIRLGDGNNSQGNGIVNIVGALDKVPVLVQQQSGSSQTKFIRFLDSGSTEVMGITTDGGFIASTDTLIKRFSYSHAYDGSNVSDGQGVGISLITDNEGNNLRDIAYIDAVQDDISEDESSLRFSVGETTPTEVMRLQSDGNVGIGTTSPAAKLDVAGNIYPTTNNTHTLGEVQNKEWSSVVTRMITGNNNRMVLQMSGDVVILRDHNSVGDGVQIKNQGNVVAQFGDAAGSAKLGIGTTSPDQLLHVAGNAKMTNIYLLSNIIHEGDVDTQIKFATDTITLDTAGSERLTIASDGNIGIGTTSPGRKLTVAGTDNLLFLDSSGNSYLTIDRSATNRRSALVFSTAGDGTSNIPDNIDWALGSADSDEVGDGTGFFIGTNTAATSAKLFISSSGYVGIGTTSPETQLDITGDLTIGDKIYTRADGNRNTYIDSGTDLWKFYGGGNELLELSWANGAIFNEGGGSRDFRVESNTNTHMLFVDASENKVGIGTTSPGSPLTVAGRVDFQNDLRLRGTDSAANQGVARFYVNSDNKFHIDTANNGNDLFVVDSAGKVGIGTTTPNQKLHVQDGNLQVNPSGSINYSWTGLNLGFGKNLPTKAGLFGASDGKVQHSDGNLYISTRNVNAGNGSYILLGQRSSDSATAKGTIILQAGTYNVNEQTGDIFFRYGTGDQLTLKGSTGNVGIGTTSPAGILHAYSTSAPIVESPSNAAIVIRRNDNVGYSSLLKYHSGNSEKFVVGLSDSGDFTGSTGEEYFIGTAKTNPLVVLKNDGKLGIGTTSPNAGLEVANAENSTLRLTRSSNSGNYLQLQGGSSGAIYNINTSGTQDHIFQTGGNEKMRITSDGKVGIGTSSPDSLLVLYSDTTTDFLKLTSGGSSANPIKLIFEKSAAEQGIIEYNRNGDMEIYNSDPDGGVMINGRNSEAGDLYVADGGNVGIGTTNPSYKLDVSGSMNHAGASYIVPATTSGASGATTVLTGATFDNATLIKASHDGVSTGNYTLELPAASSSTNRTIRIISDSSTDANHNIVIVPTSGDTLDGGTSGFTVNRNYEGLMVWSDGTEWFVIQSKNV